MNTSNWSTEKQYTLLNESIRSGITELLILKILTKGDAYGYDIYKNLTENTDGVFTFYHTAVYTYLRRMKLKGLIDTSDYVPEHPTSARRMVFYTITPEGKEYLQHGIEQFQRVYKQASIFLAD